MQSQFKILSFTLITTILASLLQFGSINLVFSQEVELLSIDTGNTTLDSSLPVFYECIDEAVDESEDAPQAPYFEEEPTKNEVRKCYQQVFVDKILDDEDED